jgi:hypothetical protein
MAKAKQPTENSSLATQTSTAIAAPIDDMFAADAGSGMEGATSESFAIPFLSVLQKGSPQVDEASGAALDGAKAGMLFDNVNSRMFDGKTGVIVVPCAYKRVFLRWGQRSGDNAGFKGEMSADSVATMRAAGQIVDMDGRLFVPLPDGTVNDKKCDSVRDTRNHYVLLIDAATGGWTQALISLTSTQIKKSKMLMSSLASVKFNGPAGMYTPPTFANLVRLTTIPESNDKGTWYGVKFELAGRIDRAEVYAAAKAFHASVAANSVEVKYEAPDAPITEGF